MDDEWAEIERVPELVTSLYAIVDELESIFPGRHFTPDGHLVGSLGEGLASYLFGVELNTASAEGYDGVVGDTKVEVKATQGTGIGVSNEDCKADVLVVFQLRRQAAPVLVYNGPANLAWELAGAPQKNGQRRISLSKLASLHAELEPGQGLQPVRNLDGMRWGG